MKKSLILGSAIVLSTLFLPTSVFGSVYIQYYNKDSKKYVMKVEMDGNTKEVTFNASTTSASTVQGTGKVGIIETPCGKVEIKDGAKIEIKDGCIKFL
ncbi:hypothetical protein [Tychonema sp. BBK16]|uniref:hypothetical protein n=2 Tax=Tychonema sp. BBK16 TaxID=2699888 RepID=UPI0038D2B7BF